MPIMDIDRKIASRPIIGHLATLSTPVPAFLFEHQLQLKCHYRQRWTNGPDQPRLIKRCQVMADKVFAHIGA